MWHESTKQVGYEKGKLAIYAILQLYYSILSYYYYFVGTFLFFI